MQFKRLESVPSSKIRAVYAKAKPGFVDLGLGMPYSHTVRGAKEAAVSAIRNNRTYYTPNAGLPEIREAIASRYGLSQENVMVTDGVAEAIFVSLFALIQPGDDVLVPDPGYPAYGAVTALTGGSAVPYPLYSENKFRLRADDVLSRITKKTRAVVLNSPSNPTGAVHASEAFEKLAKGLAGTEIAVLSDEAYGRLSLTGRPVPTLLGRLPDEQLLTLSGVSKEFAMTGWRIGWIVSHADNIARLVKGHLFMVSCASSVSQAAALGALKSGDESVMEAMRANRDLMTGGLKSITGLRFVEPDGGIYCFVDVSRYGSGDEIAADILDRINVVTIPGSGFGTLGRDFLRLSFGARPEVIREGLNRLSDYFSTKEIIHD